MQNAEMIITDSYHGLSFSIANKKNFRLIKLYNEAQNTRSFCLLKKLNLMEFIIGKNAFFKTPNWTQVDRLLEEQRKLAIEYIKHICK